MKYIYTLLLLFGLCHAQNYVLDAGMNQVSAPPQQWGFTLTQWQRCLESADNYTLGAGVPNNFFGQETSTDNAYVGMYLNGPNPETMCCQLMAPIIGQVVVELWVSLADNSGSTDSIFARVGGEVTLLNAPTNKMGWIKVSDTIFVPIPSDSFEIGGGNQHDDYIPVPGGDGTPVGYVYIDSASVRPVMVVGRREPLPPPRQYLYLRDNAWEPSNEERPNAVRRATSQ